MLPKKNRADTKTVERIFKACPPTGRDGSFFNSANLTFKFIMTRDSAPPRISIITPKSIAKIAVKRNLLKRRGYTALQKHIDKFPAGLLGVFIFKKYQDDISIIENEIKNVLNKIN